VTQDYLLIKRCVYTDSERRFRSSSREIRERPRPPTEPYHHDPPLPWQPGGWPLLSHCCLTHSHTYFPFLAEPLETPFIETETESMSGGECQTKNVGDYDDVRRRARDWETAVHVLSGTEPFLGRLVSAPSPMAFGLSFEASVPHPRLVSLFSCLLPFYSIVRRRRTTPRRPSTRGTLPCSSRTGSGRTAPRSKHWKKRSRSTSRP
jgi:hypothetical protein